MNRIQKAIVVFTVVFVAAVLSGHALVESDANQALAYLDERGIVYGDGRTFHGDEPITVEQVSAMLCRAGGFGGDTKWSVARNELRVVVGLPMVGCILSANSSRSQKCVRKITH